MRGREIYSRKSSDGFWLPCPDSQVHMVRSTLACFKLRNNYLQHHHLRLVRSLPRDSFLTVLGLRVPPTANDSALRIALGRPKPRTAADIPKPATLCIASADLTASPPAAASRHAR